MTSNQYELYVSILKDTEFQLSPYGMCVANKHLNRKQCTIAWYLDEKKLSHVEHDVIDDVINQGEEMIPGLTVTKGNMHTFLGIKRRELNNMREAINIRYCISEAVQEFGEDFPQVVTSPVERWLFTMEKVREL